MTTTPLVIQSVISGSVYLLGTAFICMRLLGLNDLLFLSTIRDYQVLIIIVWITVSYILESILHNLISMILPVGVRLFKRVFKQPIQTKMPTPNLDRSRSDVIILQHGSPNLIEVIGTRNTSLSYYLSLTFAIPYLGIGFCFWSANANPGIIWWPILLITMIFGGGCYLTYRRKRNAQFTLERAALEEIEIHLENRKSQ